MPILLFDDGVLEKFLYGLGYEGWFFFVDPADHKKLFRRGKGKWVRWEDRADYPHVRVGIGIMCLWGRGRQL